VSPDNVLQDRPAQAPALPADALVAETLPGAPRAAVASGLTPSAGRTSRLGVLRHRHFRNVWAGAMVSNIGGWMEGVGVQWIVAHTTGSPIMMAWLAAAQLGPTMILGLLGGLTADRVNRRTLLLTTQAVMMLIAALLAVASYLNIATPPILLSLALLQGIALAFNTPAWQVLTPRLVPRAELTAAIALNGLQFNLARVVGPALAGALMAAYGPTLLFVVNTATFIVVLIAIASTPDAPAPPRDARSLMRLSAEALSFVFHRRGPRAVFLATVTFAILAAPMMRMLPLFASSVYPDTDPLLRTIAHLPFGDATPREIVFGWLLAVMGAGAVFGAMAIRWIPQWYPKHHLIPLSILIAGLAITAFSASTSLLLATVTMFIGGVFWLWAFNLAMAALQLLVPDHMRGRVMSINNMAVFGAMPLGAFLAGVIGRVVSGGQSGLATQVGVGTLGAALAISGALMLIWRTPEVDGLRPGDPGYDRRPGFLGGLTAQAHRPR
jgi:MFS family permease